MSKIHESVIGGHLFDGATAIEMKFGDKTYPAGTPLRFVAFASTDPWWGLMVVMLDGGLRFVKRDDVIIRTS